MDEHCQDSAAGTFFRVDDLTVRYGPIVAVQAVSLRIEQGEIVALLGANGAGKSSFLNSLAGLVPASSGHVTLWGREIQRLRPEQIVRHGLALVPEGRRVFPRLSVADNLRLGAAANKDRSRSQSALERVHSLFPVLVQRSRQLAGTLSGGEQQMLAIGRALMSSPTLLLLDEPSLGLAPIVVEEIFNLLWTMREEGTTMLLVEQNVHRALEISDRGYVLQNGSIEREGSAEALASSTGIEEAYLGIGTGQ